MRDMRGEKQVLDEKYTNRNSPYFTDEKVHEKIDDLLRRNASIEASLGKDSTTKEKIKAKIQQDRLFEKIKILDPVFYSILIVE